MTIDVLAQQIPPALDKPSVTNSLRYLPPSLAVFITTRVEEGLPFVPSELMELIIMSTIARAQKLYPIIVNAFLFMQNHLHLIATIQDAEDISDFMDRIKTETAHAVNRLLGRRKRTIWEDGYNSLPILTYEDLIDKFAYIYTNPQKPNLVDTIDEYPGVSTWKMFINDISEKTVPWVRRPMIKPLTSMVLSEREDKARVQEIRKKAKSSHTFKLDPFAWVTSYGKTTQDIPAIKKSIIAKVRELEADFRKARTRPCMGAKALKAQPMDQAYTPTKFSPSMWCISSDKERRIAFINRIKNLRAEATAVYARWKTGDFSVPYPLGLFPPRFPRLANLVPETIFSCC